MHACTLIPHTVWFPTGTTARLILLRHTQQDTASSQPAVGLLPPHYLIGEGVSLPELHWAPLCPPSVGAPTASDTRWRPLPSGSAPGRRGPERSYRPVTTRDTWRSEDRKRRWVRSVHASSHTIHTFLCHVVPAAGVINIGVGGQCVCATPDDPRFPESCQLLHCARAVETEGWRYPWNSDLYTWQPVADQPECQEKGVSWVCPSSSRSLRLSHACRNLGRHLKLIHDAGFAALALSAHDKRCASSVILI